MKKKPLYIAVVTFPNEGEQIVYHDSTKKGLLEQLSGEFNENFESGDEVDFAFGEDGDKYVNFHTLSI